MKHIQLFEHWSDDKTHPDHPDFHDDGELTDDELDDTGFDDEDDFNDEEYDEDEEEDYSDHSKGLRFYNNCVGWGRDELDVLNHLIDNATEIKRAEFLPHVHAVDMGSLERELGYGGKNGLKMENDWHVRYFRSTDLDGKTVYFFVHSAIEYCFMETPETTEDLSMYEDDDEDDDDMVDDDPTEDPNAHPPVPMT